jgi:hypothetical protein
MTRAQARRDARCTGLTPSLTRFHNRIIRAGTPRLWGSGPDG